MVFNMNINIEYVVSAMPIEVKIGQLMLASLDGDCLDGDALDFLTECKVGGVIHFSNNVSGRSQAADFNAALAEAIEGITGVPPLIGIDHEGGRVMRIRDGSVTAFPSAIDVAAGGDAFVAEQVGAAMAGELRYMGFHINFAPVLDVQNNPRNTVIGPRSYGSEPARVAEFGAAMARGLQSGGIIACGKHFPGHGDTDVDSHFGLPRVDKPLGALEEMELIPFKAAIDAGIQAIMTSHILFPQIEPDPVPATMSPRVLQGLLRERLGFGGLIVSDGMHMDAISKEYGITKGCVEAIRAGVDLLCVGTAGEGHYQEQRDCYYALLEAAQNGYIPMERIDEAVTHVLRAKMWVMSIPSTPPDWDANKALAEAILSPRR